MEEESTVDTQSNGRGRHPATIRIANIIYRPTTDGDKRLLEVLALLLGEGVDGHIANETDTEKPT